MLTPLCGSQQTGKFFKRWEYQTTLPASWEICMQIKKQQLDPDMEQWTGSKLAKGDFSGSPEVKNLPCNAKDAGLTPGQGTKIPYADMPWSN